MQHIDLLIKDLIKLRTYYYILIDYTNTFYTDRVMLDDEKQAFKSLLESDLRCMKLLVKLGVPQDHTQYDFSQYKEDELQYKVLKYDALKYLENKINLIIFDIKDKHPQHLIEEL